MVDPDLPATFWPVFTRLGEAQLLLPLLVAAAAWLAWHRGGVRPALAWLAGTTLAALLTTGTKLAFIGHGLGWAALDFTGISGHAMFAAAVLPLLLRVVAAPQGRRGQAAWLAAGLALAAAVALSRVMVSAHSWSEVLAGLVLGAAVSAAALRTGPLPALRPLPGWPAVLLALALLGVAGAPPSRTHDWVTRLALAQAGRSQPFQRADLHRPSGLPVAGPDGRLRHGAPAVVGPSLQPH